MASSNPQIIPSITSTPIQTQPQIVGLYQVQGIQGANLFRLNSYNTMAYLLDINDPTKLYTKTLDSTGQTFVESFTLSKDELQKEDTDFVTQTMLDEILDDKLEKMFKKYMGNNRSRNNKNRNQNQNREVDYDE